MPKVVSWGLVFAFFGNPILEARAAVGAQEMTSQPQTLKEKALAIAPGAMVEVKRRGTV